MRGIHVIYYAMSAANVGVLFESDARAGTDDATKFAGAKCLQCKELLIRPSENVFGDVRAATALRAVTSRACTRW